MRERLSYANVVATLALVVAVATGGAYAASKIGPKDIKKGAVRAKHIKGNQVKAKHVARNAVRPRQLRDGTVRTAKIADGAVTGAKIADGVFGGPAPPTGPAGGALAGSYPSPTVAAGAIGAPQIADGAVGSATLAPGAVTSTRLGPMVVRSTPANISANSTQSLAQSCHSDEVVLGGGGEVPNTAAPAVWVVESYPEIETFPGGSQIHHWRVRYRNDTGSNAAVTTRAMCLMP